MKCSCGKKAVYKYMDCVWCQSCFLSQLLIEGYMENIKGDEK